MKNVRQRMIEDMTLRGLSARTQETYLDAIKALARHFSRCPEELTESQIRDYLVYLQQIRKLARSTLKVRVSALRFLYQKTLGRSWPLLDLVRIKGDRRLPVILSRQEVWTLLDQVQRPRARMSLTLMYVCGLRVSEALRLQLGDIDSQRMVVSVRRGKGNKDRSVPLPQQTLAQLRAYWCEFRPAPWLFLSRTRSAPVTDRYVRSCLKAALRQTRISKEVGCHSLRHCYATHLLDAGMDLRVVQALLGHRSLKTTMLYLHLSQSTMAEVQATINAVMTRE